MLWRSFLTIVFYWVFLIALVLLVAIIVGVVFFIIHPEYLR